MAFENFMSWKIDVWLVHDVKMEGLGWSLAVGLKAAY